MLANPVTRSAAVIDLTPPIQSRDISLQRQFLTLQRMAGNAAVASRIRLQRAHSVQRQVAVGLGYTLHPSAILWVKGVSGTLVPVASASFGNALVDDIDITGGKVGLVRVRLRATKPLEEHEYLAEWRVDTTEDNLRLWFRRDEREVTDAQLLGDKVTFGHSESGDTLQVSFVARDDPLFAHPNEVTHTVTLRVRRAPRITIGKVNKQRMQVFQPFARDKARVPDAMRTEVRAFYDSLQESTKKAMQTNEHPGEEPILIEGYASTTARQGHNDDLGTARAVAVKRLLQQFSGNSRDEIYATPSFGESRSPTATDDPRREVEDPKYRKVVVTLWE